MVWTMAAKRFTVTLERVGKTATMFQVPFDLESAFGRRRPPVLVTIRDHTWRTTPGVYDGVGYVVVNRKVKTATGVDAGDRVRVAMAVDTKPRTVECRRISRRRSPRMSRRGPHSTRCRSRTSASTSSGSRMRSAPRRARAASRARSSGSRRARPRADGTAPRRPAASVTPLRDAGGKLDDDAFAPLVDFFVASGLDGIMALGTSGEGICSRARNDDGRRTSSSRPRTGGCSWPSTAVPRRRLRRWRSPSTPPRSERTRSS